MVPDAAIAADSLTKRYGGDVAVEGLDLQVPRGTVYGFLGPNGAGKTTVIRMLTTLLRPTSGRARVAGHSIEDREAVTPHIGYVPERPPVHDELTGREQVTYVAGLHDVPDDVATTRIQALLERFDLAADADRPISAYSKGMKRKTALVQAIVHDPAVVFLDEPVSGLDPRAARTVRAVLTELAEEDTTVFLSTHVLPVVDEIADRVGVLFEGSLVAEGSPRDLKRRATDGDQTLESAFLAVTEEGPLEAPAGTSR